MKLKELIAIADEAYPDGLVALYTNDKTGKFEDGPHGDGLARFIACELCETFEPKASKKDQLNEAVRVLERAQSELQEVIDALIMKLP